MLHHTMIDMCAHVRHEAQHVEHSMPSLLTHVLNVMLGLGRGSACAALAMQQLDMTL